MDVSELRGDAEAGSVRSMLELGVRLMKDDGDQEEAVEWFKKCVNDPMVQGTACYALGYAYDYGKGVERNPKESRRWIELAAKYGNKQAMEFMAFRRKEARRRRWLDAMLLISIVIFVAVAKTLFELCYVLWHRETFKTEISGADPRTPSFRWHHDLLNDRQNLTLKARDLLHLTSKESPSDEPKQPLSESFQHTRGVVVHFTRPALKDAFAFESVELKWIKDGYLDKVLDDECNAFVFNVLVIPPGRWANRTYGVDYHVDQTLIQSTTQREQTAFTVSVGYVHVPKFIDGGHLEIAGLRHYPREGSVLVFRGDQNHGVAAFCAFSESRPFNQSAPCPLNDHDIDLQRVSFVLEQYKLPPHKLRRSPFFILAPSSLEEDLIPIISAFPLGPSLISLYLHIRKRLYFPYQRRRLASHASSPLLDPHDASPL